MALALATRRVRHRGVGRPEARGLPEDRRRRWRRHGPRRTRPLLLHPRRGGKTIGGVHDNFGVGAKIAALPWNPEGVVVLSWKGGRGSMIWIRLDPDTDDYELAEFADEGGRTVVVDPDLIGWTAGDADAVDWSKVRPDWITEHGTVIVLLGREGHEDTVLGNPDAKEGDLKGLSLYLNTRFWDLSDIEVNVVELSTEQKNQWPTGPSAANGSKTQRRRARGAQFYLTDVTGGDGKLAASDMLSLDEDRVTTEWYLWEGERPKIGPYARRGGYIAVRYNGELFHVMSSKIQFRWFGIIEGGVQHRTTIILEPRHFGTGTGKWGIHPDQSRNRLIFSGGGERGVEVPLADWGLLFVADMPEPIRAAIMAERGDLAAEIQDEEIRKRLQDKFGDRWRTRRLVVTTSGKPGAEPATALDDEDETAPDVDLDPGTSGTRKPRLDRATRVLRRLASVGGDGAGVPKEAPVDVPKIGFLPKSAFQKEWHIAMYAPNDPQGPTVYINTDSGILQEVVEYHQEQYHEIHQEEVTKTVRLTFGEVAACKVAHAQKLTKLMPAQELDEKYRSEAALTIGLMGLLAEESLISQRLGRLGPKKKAE